MLKPDFVQSADWNLLVSYCISENTNPYLIVAIGVHETGWGTLGWGKHGYILGVGCFNETNADPTLQGFDAQIAWATKALGKFYGIHPSYDEINEFAAKIWRPGNPKAWATSVWKIYKDLLEHFAPDLEYYVNIPEYARQPLLMLFQKGILNTPFGSTDFYRCMTVINRVLQHTQ